MAKYYPVWPKYWRGARKRWDDQAKLLGLYLLTCEHRNLEGLYFLPKSYVVGDLGWPMRTVDRALSVLIADGFCAYDEDAEVILVPKALAHQAPKTEKQITGATRALALVPDTSLWHAFLEACRSHAPSLADAIGNGITNPSGTDPDNARTHSSSSTSNSRDPLTPKGELPPVPRKPRGNRQRERQAHEEAVKAYAAAHFPSLPDPNRWQMVRSSIANGAETHEAIATSVRQWTEGVVA